VNPADDSYYSDDYYYAGQHWSRPAWYELEKAFENWFKSLTVPEKEKFIKAATFLGKQPVLLYYDETTRRENIMTAGLDCPFEGDQRQERETEKAVQAAVGIVGGTTHESPDVNNAPQVSVMEYLDKHYLICGELWAEAKYSTPIGEISWKNEPTLRGILLRYGTRCYDFDWHEYVKTHTTKQLSPARRIEPARQMSKSGK
jgi:hypothetical protein